MSKYKDLRSHSGKPLKESGAEICLTEADKYRFGKLQEAVTTDLKHENSLDVAAEPEIRKMLSSVDYFKDEIAAKIKLLFERLDPVLSPAIPSEMGVAWPEPKTVVGKRIGDTAKDLSSLNDALREMLARLEV